ncbi:CoA transferase [soil metagenome]
MSAALLDGVRVVEFGNLIAAPYAAMLLADLGAEVIKVEPTSGDLGRGFGPYVEGESVFFMAANRGKRSIAIDPKDAHAQPWLKRLVGSADVVINNLRHGAMERMGYDEAALREINPTAVYAVVSAFGSDGPFADRAGIDVIFQAESGMISITGRPHDPPQKTATTIGDYVAATNAALTICAALFERERTGVGHRVDVALRDGLLAVQAGWWALFFASGRQPDRIGTASPYLAPNQVFPSADRHFALAIVSDRHFEALCDVIGRPDLAERYPTTTSRMDHRDELVAELEQVFATRPSSHWVAELGDAGLPVGDVLDFESVLADPQIQHNEMVVTTRHPAAGKVRGIGSPLRVDGRPALSERPSPTLGEHSRAVLSELGAEPAVVDMLIQSGSVVVT